MKAAEQLEQQAMLATNKIHCMDAIEGLKKLPNESVDLVVTDPPYNIASPKKLTISKGKVISTQQAWGAWDTFHPFDFDLLIMKVISECYRVLRPGGAIYLFTAREDNGFFIRKAVERGFTYRNQLAMVRKNPLPSFYKNNWRSGYETCMYLTKGTTRVFNFSTQAEHVNIYHFPSGFKHSKHPTEKPLGFIKRLVQTSSNPGDLVLDPFMGSGTTAVASQQLGRQFVGFELSKEYIKMANTRLQKEASPDSGGKASGGAACV